MFLDLDVYFIDGLGETNLTVSLRGQSKCLMIIATSINISIIISLNAAKCSDIVYKCDPTHPQALSHLFRFNKSLPMPPNWTRVKKELTWLLIPEASWNGLFFQAVARTDNDKFHDRVISESLLSGLPSRSVASWLSFAPSNKIQQPKIWVISELDRCNIYCMDKISSKLVFLRNLQ